MNRQDIDRLCERLIQRVQNTPPPGDTSESPALQALTQSLVDLGIADDVGITEVDSAGAFRTVAPTSEVALDADRAQYRLSEGPCVEASYDFASTLSSSDVYTDGRWPRWGPAAAAIGVTSVISMRLYAAGTPATGALNMYSRTPRIYTSDNLSTARIAASVASVELAHHRNDANLWRAIDSRHRIGQAQGILMERFDIDDAASFAVLRRYSQARNAKLAVVADELVRTRLLPQAS